MPDDESPLFTTESQYRAALKTQRAFVVTWRELKQISSAGARTEQPQHPDREHEEQELFHRLVREVIPTLRSAINLTDPMNALGAAIDSVSDWRESHPSLPIDKETWTPVFEASQMIEKELLRWSEVYPTAYREEYSHQEDGA